MSDSRLNDIQKESGRMSQLLGYCFKRSESLKISFEIECVKMRI